MSEKQKAYERFKLQWMIDHGYTLEDLMNAMEDLKREAPFVDLRMIFDHCQFDCGFGSEIWPCYDEWIECEYKEEMLR